MFPCSQYQYSYLEITNCPLVVLMFWLTDRIRVFLLSLLCCVCYVIQTLLFTCWINRSGLHILNRLSLGTCYTTQSHGAHLRHHSHCVWVNYSLSTTNGTNNMSRLIPSSYFPGIDIQLLLSGVYK